MKRSASSKRPRAPTRGPSACEQGGRRTRRPQPDRVPAPHTPSRSSTPPPEARARRAGRRACGSGFTISPRPVQSARPPSTKNAVSLPTEAAIRRSASRGAGDAVQLEHEEQRAHGVAAAGAEARPRRDVLHDRDPRGQRDAELLLGGPDDLVGDVALPRGDVGPVDRRSARPRARPRPRRRPRSSP